MRSTVRQSNCIPIPSLFYSFPYFLLLYTTADVKLAWPHVPFMLQFIDHVAKDEEHTDSIVAHSAGLLGYMGGTN